MEYWCFFHAYDKKTKNLSDQELGRLVRALNRFSQSGEPEQLEGRESIAYDFIVDDIEKAKIRYKEKCQNNRANRNGRKRTSTDDNECEQPLTNDNERQRTSTDVDERDQTKDKNKKQKEKDIYVSTTHTAREAIPYMEIMAVFNNTCVDLPSITTINSTRKTLTACRYRESGSVEEMQRIFEIVQQSDFLTGRVERGRAWKASFDWIIKAANWQKIKEGNYCNRQSCQQQASQAGDIAANGRYAPTYDIAEVEQMFDEEWED